MVYELVGWVGAVMVLGAYWLVTRSGTSILYHTLNVIGAGGLLVNALYHRTFPSTALDVVWIGIAFWGIANTRQRRTVPGTSSA